MTKYYKKVWGDFSSPILNTQNYATYVTDTNITDVYKLFDGDTSTYVYLGLSTPVYYVNLKFPNEIDITNFVLSAQRYNPAWPPSSVKFYAKADDTWSYLGGFDRGSIAWEGGLNMPYSLDNRIVSKELRIELGGGTLVGGGISYSAYALELSFTGQQITSIIEISEAEYEANKADPNYFKVDGVAVKDYLASQRKYYKKVNTIVESPWTQPVLKSRGTLGGNSFAVQSASNTSGSYHDWQAFDGNVNTWWISGEDGTNANYYIYNPVPLHITNIYIDGGSYYFEGRFNKLVVFGSNDNSNYTLIDTIQTTLQNTYNLQIKNNKGYKYYKFNFQNTNNPNPGYISIKEIKLTATQLIGGISWQECTKEEYNNSLVYYKKIETTFNQPTLTSNGTLGGNSFAVQATSENYGGFISPAYQAFTNNTTLRHYEQGWAAGGNQSITFYNPVAIKITQLNLYIGCNDGYFGITAGTIFVSNDNQNWTQLQTFTAQDGSTSSVINNTINLSSNTGFYKYYKITATSSSTHGSGLACVKITATEQTWQECTKQEYDLLPDSDRMLDSSNRRMENRYMANVGKKYLKKVTVEAPWPQPILTSNGTLGGDSFAVADDGHANTDVSGDAWRLFNPDGGVGGYTNWSWRGNKTPGGITIYNPIPLKITNIQVTNHAWANASLGAGYGITGGIIQASNDNSTWVNLKTFTNSVVALSETWNIDLSDNTNAYKYYRIWITSHSSNAYGGDNYIGQLLLTATQQTETWQECTKQEYDLLPDSDRMLDSSNRRMENKYYITKVA